MHDCWFHTGGCFHYTAIGCYNWLHGCGHCPHKQTELLYPFNDNTKGILSDRIRFFGAIQKLTIVGVSNWIVQQAKLNVFKDRPSMVIYNGVNMDLFRPSESNFRAKMGWGDKQIILCPANKWQDAINRQTFLYFLEHINSQQIIVLFGARKKYRTHHPQLYYIDYINDKRELAKLYSCADVMVNCTREESLSFINIEAQSCGTPVVTYDGTGVVETVDGLCGFAVPTGDYVQLFARTMQILTNKPLAKECRKWVADHFDKDKNYKLYVNCYRKILRQ